MNVPATLLLSALLLATAAPAETRTFTSRNGKTIEAEIVSATDQQVELKTIAGKTFTVPLSSLSDKDALHISIWREEQAKKKALTNITLDNLFQAQGVGSVNFRNDQGLIFVEAFINDKAANFLVDYRQEMTLLDEPAVAKLGLEMKAATQQGAKGQVDVASLKFGITDLGADQIIVVALDNLPAALRPKIDGILGSAFLQKHRVLLDYAEMKLWLRPEKGK